MNLNEVDIHYLIAAICVITSALVFYTIGVWGERLQKKLKFLFFPFHKKVIKPDLQKQIKRLPL